MKRGKIMRMFIIGLLAASIVAFSNGGALASETEWPAVVSFGTAVSGSSYHALGLSWAGVVGKSIGHKISAQATGGSSANMALLKEGKIHLAQANTQDDFLAARGIQRYKERGKADIRLMMCGYDVNWSVFARKAAGIKGFPDLKGKNCYFDLPPAPILMFAAMVVLEAYGLTEKDIRVKAWSSWSEVKSALAEGKMDAASGPGSMGVKPHPSINEMFQTHDMILLSPSEKAQEYVMKKYPFFGKGVVKAGTYRNQNSDCNAISLPISWITRSDIPDEWVYTMVKGTWENLDKLSVSNAAFKSFILKRAARSFVIPYHPGAIKYYKEAGVWTAEMDAKQKKVLEELKK